MEDKEVNLNRRRILLARKQEILLARIKRVNKNVTIEKRLWGLLAIG